VKLIGIVVSIALVIMLLLPGVALAGGWSVVSLDRVPADVMAREKITIGFRVLQHGQHPVSGLETHIEATHLESGRQIMFPASEAGTPGHYSATITLPEVGIWEWAVVAFEGPHIMYPLEVQPAKAFQGNLPAGPTPGHKTQLSSEFWNWTALGSGIAAVVTFFATAGIATRIPAIWITRARSRR
jgi:hypothetical protein